MGHDIGAYGAKYIVTGAEFLTDVCGFKMGFSSDLHADVPATEHWDFINLHEVFSVSAGTNTFAFVGSIPAGAVYYITYTRDASMTVLFVPTAYGDVDAVAESDGNLLDLSSTAAQPMLYTSESLPAASEGVRSRNVRPIEGVDSQ